MNISAKFPMVIPPLCDSAGMQNETAVILAHVGRFKGRVFKSKGRGISRAFRVIRPGAVSGTVYVEGRRMFRLADGKTYEERFAGAYVPGIIGVHWHDDTKTPLGFKERSRIAQSNSALCWMLASGVVPYRLRDFKHVGPRLTLGGTVIGKDGVPVYPHELGAVATPDQIDTFVAACHADADPYAPSVYPEPDEEWDAHEVRPTIRPKAAAKPAPTIRVRLSRKSEEAAG